MKVLIIGNGGREHALAWKAVQSENVKQVFVAPGNAGTAAETRVENINLSATDIDGLLQFATENSIGLTIVGPEAPLSSGIVDRFTKAGLACFGPMQATAQLESSKEFAKKFMVKHHIPTAAFMSFTDADAAKEYVRHQTIPIVIKADGLAAGKGVVIADTLSMAEKTIDAMLQDNQFGEAGHRIVIEEFLKGEEASYIVMCDGKNFVPLASSQDHKKRDNADQGPNTGGMGAYSPAPVVTSDIETRILKTVIEPVIRGMNDAGTPYVGFLYAGLMIQPDGNLKVLEFNCRLGDPEAEVILLRLQSDLIGLCQSALRGEIGNNTVKWDPRPALGVVLAAGGYPDHHEKGFAINGLETQLQDCKVFHAATALNNNRVVTHGGRVLCVCALGETLVSAQSMAYQQVGKISWDGMFYRSDIGFRAI